MNERYMKQFKTKPSSKDEREKERYKLDGYEKNLKLNLEAKRKDLDILTTAVLPHQINLIKTYLWFASLSIPVALLASRTQNIKPATFILIIIAIFFLIMVAIECLTALDKSKNRFLAHITKDEHFRIGIKHDKLEHSQGIYDLLVVTSEAIDGVTKTITQTAEVLQGVRYLILVSIGFLIFAFTVHAFTLVWQAT
jgi:hypothetical protein